MHPIKEQIARCVTDSILKRRGVFKDSKLYKDFYSRDPHILRDYYRIFMENTLYNMEDLVYEIEWWLKVVQKYDFRAYLKNVDHAHTSL